MKSKVLIHVHGNLPDEQRPVVGNGLRARQLGDSLAARGIETVYITHRNFYESEAAPERVLLFETPRDFLRELDSGGYGLLICVQGEGLELLPDEGQSVPVLADWIAPRLMEFAFQGLPLEQWLPRLIANIRKADYHSCCTEVQRAYLLSLLQLAGHAASDLHVVVVPLSAPAQFSRRPAPGPEPVFVAGGVYWPWIRSARFLRILVEELESAGYGRLKVFGGRYPFPIGSAEYQDLAGQLPASSRLEVMGMMPYPAIMREYLRADVAVNLFEENAERQMALSFREIDYLRAGVPLVCTPFSYISPMVRRHGGGWVLADLDDDTVRAAFRKILAQRPIPRELSNGARRILREHFDQDKTIVPLLGLMKSPRKKPLPVSLLQSAFLWGEHARTRLEAVEADRGRLNETLREKEKSLEGLQELETGHRQDLAASAATIRELRGYLARKESDLESSQALLREKDAALVQQQANIDRMQEYITRKETDLARLADEAGGLREQSARLESARQDLSAQVAAQAAEIERQRAYIQEKEKDNAELLRLLSEKDQALGYGQSAQAQLQERLDRLGADLKSAESRFRAQEALYANSLKDLAGAAATIAELKAYVAEKDAQLAELMRLSAEKDRALGAMDVRVADLEAENGQCRTELSEAKESCEKLQEAYTENEAHLRESAATIAGLRDYTARKETELAGLMQLTAEKDRALGAMEARIASLETENRHSREELQAARASRQQLQEAYAANEGHLRESAAAMAELKSYLARKEADLAGLMAICRQKDEALGKLDARATRLETDLNSSAELANQLRDDHQRLLQAYQENERNLAASASTIAELRAYSSRKEEDLARLLAMAGEKDQAAARLEENLKTQADVLQEVRAYLALKERDLARCVALIDEKDQSLRSQQEELDARQRRLEQLEQAVSEQLFRIGELEGSLGELQSKPLYKIYRKLRGK